MNVRFVEITQEAFNNLQIKDNNTLYFVIISQTEINLYKGSKKVV